VNTKSVSILKDKIKAKKSPAFDHIPADNLDLWNVSLLVDRNLKQNLNNLSLPDKPPLPPLLKLSNVFSKLKQDHLYIVVRVPGELDMS
jgi:Crinkler effector protein N-terminal domain